MQDSQHHRAPAIKVGIFGLGTIGRSLAQTIARGIPGVKLDSVAVRDRAKAEAFVAGLGQGVAIVDAETLADRCDVVIECAPTSAMLAVGTPVLTSGKKLVVLSSGGLLAHPGLLDLAMTHGGQILVPSGALLGLDAVSAAREGVIHSVKMITRKPVRGLVGAPYLVDNGIDIENLPGPKLVFSGTAREAIKGFPANVNVAVALSLAGIGPDKTTIEIWADPALTRNTHRIDVDSDSACFSMSIENIPSENPKTGRITAQSVISLLRKMSDPLRVGS